MNSNNSSSILIDKNNFFNELIYEWFVRYNPLYFVSAACFIFGVFLVSKGIYDIDWIDGQIILTGVIEFYQWLALAGSFILYRSLSQTRPAVILAIMNIVFLFDCTYQTEHLSSVPYIGGFLSVLWILLFAVKLKVLTSIFHLKLPVVGFIAAILAAIGIAATPHLLYSTIIDPTLIHLAMTWYGVGLVLVVLWWRPVVVCQIDLEGFSKTVLRRAAKAAWMIWGGFYLFHLISWIRFFDIVITFANLAPVFVVLAFFSKREEFTWAGCMFTFLLSSLNPSLFWINSFLLGFVFLFNGLKNHQPRLYLGMIMSLHFAAAAVSWEGGPLPDPASWIHILTAICLIATGAIFRLYSAGITVLIWVFIYWKPRGPGDIMEWGSLFIAIGFASLIAGVILNWKFRFWPANGGSGRICSPVQNPENVSSANRRLHAKSPEAKQKGLAKDLDGFCPYCSFHMNAGSRKCDKCGKIFY
jgi:hypothetical protein